MKHPTKYPRSIIIIHWLTVILFAVIFYIGITMEEYEFNEANINRYRPHAILGMIVSVLSIIRFFIKKKNADNLPPEITYYSIMHKKFVKTVTSLMYLLLIIAPIVGFIMVYQTGALDYDLGGPFPTGAKFDETLEVLHKTLVFILTGLIIIHIAGIFIYKIKTGENLIKRMCLLIK